MTVNNELERKDIVVCDDMEVDCDIGQQINVYLETWFDVDKKFGTDVLSDDDAWLNLYAKYNPFEDTLYLQYDICRSNGSDLYDYEPTAAEDKLIKEMITEKIRELYSQTPQEFCEGYYAEEQAIEELK